MQVTSLDVKLPTDSSVKHSPYIEAVIAHLKTWSDSTPRIPGRSMGYLRYGCGIWFGDQIFPVK